jgi:hypothetical protein
MPELSLTDFVGFAVASGTAKLTKVREFKSRPPYDPTLDFYKQVREGMIDCHRAGDPKARLEAHVGTIADKKKMAHFQAIVDGYRSWWGKKSLVWLEPPRSLYSEGGVSIRVNPELGLSINGDEHLIKLYFKTDKLSKSRVDVITHLLDKALRADVKPHTRMGVLDVRESRLLTPTVPIAGLDAMLTGELAYLAAVWDKV